MTKTKTKTANKKNHFEQVPTTSGAAAVVDIDVDAIIKSMVDNMPPGVIMTEASNSSGSQDSECSVKEDDEYDLEMAATATPTDDSSANDCASPPQDQTTEANNHNENPCCLCPLTGKLFVDPVVHPDDGLSYEKSAIAARDGPDLAYYPNRALKGYLEDSPREKRNHFFCPITCALFQDPVIDPEGYSYERLALLDWLQKHKTSPNTRKPLEESQLYSNKTLFLVLLEEIQLDDDWHTKSKCFSGEDDDDIQQWKEDVSSFSPILLPSSSTTDETTTMSSTSHSSPSTTTHSASWQFPLDENDPEQQAVTAPPTFRVPTDEEMSYYNNNIVTDPTPRIPTERRRRKRDWCCISLRVVVTILATLFLSGMFQSLNVRDAFLATFVVVAVLLSVRNTKTQSVAKCMCVCGGGVVLLGSLPFLLLVSSKSRVFPNESLTFLHRLPT